jgi:hypothetical protein
MESNWMKCCGHAVQWWAAAAAAREIFCLMDPNIGHVNTGEMWSGWWCGVGELEIVSRGG